MSIFTLTAFTSQPLGSYSRMHFLGCRSHAESLSHATGHLFSQREVGKDGAD